jgi:tetratricopeptide (TPR) repeat protein
MQSNLNPHAPSQVLAVAFSAYRAGKLIETEQLCRQVIAATPDVFDALHLLAIVQSRLGRKEEALEIYDRALVLQPHHAEALSNRGATLHDLKRFEEALASYDRALAAQPDLAQALCNRGVTLQAQNRPEEALSSYDCAIAVRPDYAKALSNRGATLYALQRFKEALVSYDRAIAAQPAYAEAHLNRGVCLNELQRFDEALESHDRALAVRPNYAAAHCNRGVTLHELKRFGEALASYNCALAVRPDYAEAHFNEGLCRALLGDYRRGLELFEWRWEAEQKKDKRNFVQPLWLGADDIVGKTILLHAEQGFGDTIQFCRFAPLVAARGARVIMEVPRPLHLLMGSLSGVAQVISRREPFPVFDVHSPLLSLPLAFGSQLETIPAAVPYLRASPQSLAQWNARLGPKRRARVGLAWSGGPAHRHRSMRLGALSPLFDVDATFVSLQKDVPPHDIDILRNRSEVLDFSDELTDFSETAALISTLDLIISIDTAVAHLAGALAKPAWVLLPFVPDWRWLLDRDDSPWYPTARLFRQDETRAWDNVIARVHAALGDFVTRHP